MSMFESLEPSENLLFSNEIRAEKFGTGWHKLLATLIDRGVESAPRGLKTKELLAVKLQITNARYNILINNIRNPNYKFMVAEWLWIWFGREDVESIASYNKEMAKFSDDGRYLAGAYGPRLYHQWYYVREQLKQVDSRQAVMSIWMPSPRPSKDIPCTLTLQFLVRQSYLHTIVNMRSSDIWLGLPYDFFTFSMLANTMAADCGAKLGSLTMNLGSSHLYETQYKEAELAVNVFSESLRSPALTEAPDQRLNYTLSGYPREMDLPRPWQQYDRILQMPRIETLRYLKDLSDDPGSILR